MAHRAVSRILPHQVAKPYLLGAAPACEGAEPRVRSTALAVGVATSPNPTHTGSRPSGLSRAAIHSPSCHREGCHSQGNHRQAEPRQTATTDEDRGQTGTAISAEGRAVRPAAWRGRGRPCAPASLAPLKGLVRLSHPLVPLGLGHGNTNWVARRLL